MSLSIVSCAESWVNELLGKADLSLRWLHIDQNTKGHDYLNFIKESREHANGIIWLFPITPTGIPGRLLQLNDHLIESSSTAEKMLAETPGLLIGYTADAEISFTIGGRFSPVSWMLEPFQQGMFRLTGVQFSAPLVMFQFAPAETENIGQFLQLYRFKTKAFSKTEA
jgi:putative NADPH-quinone reductase